MAQHGLQKLFSTLYDTYDRLNHLLTFGGDIVWRRVAARQAARIGGRWWVDVCSGTGDMAVALNRVALPGTRVVAVDFCEPMLRVAQKKKGGGGISLVIADAGRLPFRDASVDLTTISFATRNLNAPTGHLRTCFAEFARILAPGGVFLNLETSQPRNPVLRALFHVYVKTVVAPLGWLVSGSREGYRYLSYTIPRFAGAEELQGILTAGGFGRVAFRRMLGGITAVHTAWK